jgi:hypothetical protein
MDPSPTTPPTIIALVEQAVRDWVRAVDLGDECDPRDLTKEAAYCVFYMDALRPNQIQTTGSDADRCGIRIEPSDVAPAQDGAALVVDVTLAHRRDGQPTVTEFQVSLNEDLKVLVH